jgi:hypothetical protein
MVSALTGFRSRQEPYIHVSLSSAMGPSEPRQYVRRQLRGSFAALGKRKKGDESNCLKEDESKRMKVEKGMRRVALTMHYNELTFAEDTDDSTYRAAEEYTDEEDDEDEDEDEWEDEDEDEGENSENKRRAETITELRAEAARVEDKA